MGVRDTHKTRHLNILTLQSCLNLFSFNTERKRLAIPVTSYHKRHCVASLVGVDVDVFQRVVVRPVDDVEDDVGGGEDVA